MPCMYFCLSVCLPVSVSVSLCVCLCQSFSVSFCLSLSVSVSLCPSTLRRLGCCVVTFIIVATITPVVKSGTFSLVHFYEYHRQLQLNVLFRLSQHSRGHAFFDLIKKGQVVMCVLCFVLKHKRFRRTLFIRTKRNMRIFGVSPFIKLQNDT